MKYFFALLPLLLASCGSSSHSSHEKSAQEKPSPVTVTTAAAAITELPAHYEATGTVTARNSTIIAARTMGYVLDLRVNLGDRVRRGQVLATLDARETKTASEAAAAARDEVSSAIPEADSAIAAAQAQYDLAAATHRRMQDLLAKKSLTQQEFDEANARLQAAQAQLRMAQARRRQLDARLAQTEQAIQSASIQTSYTSITAPFDGIVAAKNVELGALATPGQPLLTLERDGAYQLEAAVEQSRLFALRPGQTAQVFIDGKPEPLTARISEIVPTLDPATRTGTVKLALPASPGLRSGLFGRAQFEDAPQKVLTVPASAVREQGQLQAVFVVENNVARSRLVTLGRRAAQRQPEDRIEILSGLKEGEKVIAPLPNTITDATPVEVR